MNFKNNKGSITIFVLIALLFMSGYLILSYGSNINKSKLVDEQFNIISGIYSHNDGDANAYERAYADLRMKNKRELESSISNNKTIILEKTFEEKLKNYKLYGPLGTQIKIKVTNQDASKSKTYTINLSSSLQANEYISFYNRGVLRANGTLKQFVNLPEISAYEDYTKIEIISGGTPSKMIINYIGYTLEGRS